MILHQLGQILMRHDGNHAAVTSLVNQLREVAQGQLIKLVGDQPPHPLAIILRSAHGVIHEHGQEQVCHQLALQRVKVGGQVTDD